MNTVKQIFPRVSPLALMVSLAVSGQSFAEDFSFTDAMKNGEAKVSFRARYENVDQDGFSENANALTNRTRVTFNSAKFGNWKFNVEMDNVTAIVEDYNSTVNGKGGFPVVADPEGTDLNQANFSYQSGDTTAVLGRQRINLDGQRFVGGVGWRQNEQTFDALLVNQKFTNEFDLSYAYVHNVNRIFGPDGAASDIYGDHHILAGGYQLNDDHKLSFTGIFLDPENVEAAGSTTFGIDYKGKAGMASWNLAWATQSDDGHAPVDYNADYMLAELTLAFEPVSVAVGYEVLGSDDGVKGFATPLATLHKFQGFADKFLNTPDDGVEDLYVKVSGKAGPAKLALIYHEFAADNGSADYGDEIDLVANFAIDKTYSIMVKYASYSADTFATDTDKLWLMFSANY